MSLGQLLLAVTLILVGLTWLGWVAIAIEVLGGFALASGIMLMLEGFNAISVSVARPNRQ